VPGVIRITIAAKGRYFFSQKSATVKIVHCGRLGIDLGHVVSREFFNSFDRLARPAVVGLVLLAQAIRRLHWPRCSVYNLHDVVS
jgi:hypothetical protein